MGKLIFPNTFWHRAGIVALLILSVHLGAWEFQLDVSNQFTLTGLVVNEMQNCKADFAWKPELFSELYLNPDVRISGDVIADNRVSLSFAQEESAQSIDFSLYRAWLAASYKSTELKAGLQHIRFGPAQIFRPLQWFDNIEPLSLLQDSEGLPALTLTHFFPNPEIKLWLLPATGKPRSYDYMVATKKGTVEFGGHVGMLSSLGETGLSYNQRVVSHLLEDDFDAREYQIGLDQRVDSFIGAWLETDIRMFDHNVLLEDGEGFPPLPRYYGSATVGADYTLGIGNGLYLMGEGNYEWSLNHNNPCIDKGYDYYELFRGAVVLRYPLGLLDSVQCYVSYINYDWHSDTSGSLSWRRTYDKLSWDLSLGVTQTKYPSVVRHTATASLTVNYNI